MNFEIQVKTELIKQGKTLTELAHELGISVTYLSDIVRGNRKAKIHKERICDILNIKRKESQVNHGSRAKSKV